jgi:hypothetical protein
MKRIILLNIVFFVLLMLIFIGVGFAMGYASGARYGTDAAILYVLTVTIHLFLNYLIMHRQPDFSPKRLLIASLLILLVYLVIVFH